MTATSWEPVYELHAPITRVTAAYVVTGLLDRWFLNPHLPVAENSFTTWLMDETGYVRPPAEVIVAVPSSGRGWPRH